MKMAYNISSLLNTRFGSQVRSFISEYVSNTSLTEDNYFLIYKRNELDDIGDGSPYNLTICCPLINDFLDINSSLNKINDSLKEMGLFIGRVETLEGRKERLASRCNVYSYKAIVIYELLFKRVLPKISGFRGLYKKFGILKHQLLSKCEALGRLRYCGFDIVATKETDNYLCFLASKSQTPSKENPHDGLFVKIPKVGKNGSQIYCYKLRTMHAYANYLNDYILRNHRIDNEGKVIEDFRKTGWGKFLRKFWIDEIPQLINVLKGDLSLVGLRPLSKEFLSLYPEDWRRERLKIKPGFVPPYYAHCPKTFEEIIASEKRYHQAKMRHPVKTDFRYFFQVLWNFLSGRARTG